MPTAIALIVFAPLPARPASPHFSPWGSSLYAGARPPRAG